MLISAMSKLSISNTIQGTSPQSIVEELNHDVKEICTVLTPDQKFFPQGLDHLYQKGTQIIAAEVKNQPLVNSSIVSTLNTLDEQGGWTTLQEGVAKVCRIFLELTWYRSFVEKQPVSLEFKGSLLPLLSGDVKDFSTATFSADFEYKCSLQAIKLLRSLASQGFSSLGNSPSDTFTQLTEEVKTLAQKIGSDKVEAWYLEVHQLRWRAATIRSLDDFNHIITPVKAHFQEKGHQFTLGLVSIYKDLLKNKDVSSEVKAQIADELVELIHLQDKDFFPAFGEKGIGRTASAKLDKETKERIEKDETKAIKPEEFKQIALDLIKKHDRYHFTQVLIQELVQDLRVNKSDASFDLDGYINTSKIKERITQLIKQYEAEVTSTQEKRVELKLFINELEQFIQPTRDIYTKEEMDARAEEVKSAGEELQDARAENMDFEVVCESLEYGLQALRNFLRNFDENFNAGLINQV
ncbi:hypothetical protein [Rhabdochlamydiaceae symbiont of Dictyostelium giganteum]|uniref:hypothetical protein n=1 Tax=Rhabdochlamydiaceae symbiont of Dictyostelium giganteum TaxID=3342349 RepID=UPI00384DEEE0